MAPEAAMQGFDAAEIRHRVEFYRRQFEKADDRERTRRLDELAGRLQPLRTRTADRCLATMGIPRALRRQVLIWGKRG